MNNFNNIIIDKMIQQIRIIFLTAIYNKIHHQEMSSTQVLLRSIIKSSNPLVNSICPQQYSKSSTKRLYESVFRIIDFDQPTKQFQFTNTNSNGNKIQEMIVDDSVLAHLYQKMKQQNVLDHYPILKICCHQIISYPTQSNHMFDYNSLYQLEYKDLVHIFSKFGDLNKIILNHDSKVAYAFFNTFHTSYFALKLLNGLQLNKKQAQLSVSWAGSQDYNYLMPQICVYLNCINWHLTYKYISRQQQSQNSQLNSKQNKLTCRYEIQIQNQRQFQVARRIIGSKGINMKKIIQESIELARNTQYYAQNQKYFDHNINELLKLRLRGKGSGYKQGPQQQQSQQSLHLCVSAKDQICYQLACEKVQSLLESVYSQYYQHTCQLGHPCQLLISKNPFQSIPSEPQVQFSCQQSQPNPFYQVQSLNITPNRICQLLQLRNKARRQLNFAEADRIRNFLRNCGVCLIDQKGRRGRAIEVTTWKYIF